MCTWIKRLLGLTISLLVLEAAFAQPEQFHGEVVDTIITVTDYPCDLVFQNDTLWVIEDRFGDQNSAIICAYLYPGNELVEEIRLQIADSNQARGLEKDGDEFFISTLWNMVYHTRRDGSIIDSCYIQMPWGVGFNGLTWRDSALWVSVGGGYSALLAEIDLDFCFPTQTIGVGDASGVPMGLACDNDGYLWTAYWPYRLLQVDHVFGYTTGVLDVPMQEPRGLYCDGYYFWIAGNHTSPDTGVIYKIRVLEWEDAAPTPPLPATFWVGEPYPNPFNTSVSIPYSLGPGQECEIVVTNILGQTVRKLSLQQGTGSFIWNGRQQNGHPAAGRYSC